jgi:hypothetical protein
MKPFFSMLSSKLMDARCGNTEVGLHVRFCRWPLVDFGVVVDEGEVLALLRCVIGHAQMMALMNSKPRGHEHVLNGLTHIESAPLGVTMELAGHAAQATPQGPRRP